MKRSKVMSWVASKGEKVTDQQATMDGIVLVPGWHAGIGKKLLFFIPSKMLMWCLRGDGAEVAVARWLWRGGHVPDLEQIEAIIA